MGNHTLKQISIVVIILTFLVAFFSNPVFASNPTPTPTPKPTKTITISSSGIINYSTSSLHVSGAYIKDPAGDVIHLRGVDYSYFIDDPFGTWTLSSGGSEWSTWDTSAVNYFLDEEHSWGVNVIHVLTTSSFWITNQSGFRSHLEYFINQAANRGMYVELTYWRNNQTEQHSNLPFYDPGNGYINSISDFVNLWSSTANELKAYPNVLFNFWDEPAPSGPYGASDWFSASQQCINAIRAVGSTNLIVIQWCLGIADHFNGFVGDMSWVTTYPLTDSSDNLVYSTHFYTHPDNWYNYPAGKFASSNAEITQVLTDCLVLQTAALHPVFIDAIGCDLYASDLSTEYTWFNNTLGLLNQDGIGYAVFCAPPWNSNTEWGLVMAGQPNYTPNQAGQILKQQLVK